MKFSESWLRTLVDPQLTSAELSHLLTMAGLEVEELDPTYAVVTRMELTAKFAMQNEFNENLKTDKADSFLASMNDVELSAINPVANGDPGIGDSAPLAGSA